MHQRFHVLSWIENRWGYGAVASMLLLNTVGGALAQTPAAQPNRPAAAPQRWRLSAPVSHLLPGRGARLEGGAVFTSPELEVRAPIMEADMQNANGPLQIRALNGVTFKMNLTQPGNPTPSHLEGRSDDATFNRAQNTVVLHGNVDGWYQIGQGQKNTLRGSTATFTYAQPNLKIDVEGGPQGVRFEFAPPAPRPTPAPANNQGHTTQSNQPGNNGAGNNHSPQSLTGDTMRFGTVVITAQRATVNAVLNTGSPNTPGPRAGNNGTKPAPATNSATGTARFMGNARAVSNDGPQKFDVAAPEFVVTRDATEAMETLKTVGRTQLKVDFAPPPPPAVVNAGAPNGSVPNGGAANVGQPSNVAANNQPTHVEAETDVLTIQPGLNQMVLEGNIVGFYRVAAPGEAALDYHFTGANRVILKNVTPAEVTPDNPAGLRVDAYGAPVVIETPGLFQFGGSPTGKGGKEK